MIDLTKFTRPREFILPIINNRSQINHRKLFFTNIQDGWYKVYENDEAETRITSEADEIDIDEILFRLPSIKGYAYQDSIVPIHFSSVKFRFGYSETIKVHFLKSDMWQIIDARRWEDGNLFYKGLNYTIEPEPINSVKDRFERERPLDGLKFITPEMRYLFILASLERDNFKEIQRLEQLKIDESEKKRVLEEFQKTVGGRLIKTVKDAGAHLIRYHKKGKNDLVVIWSVGGEEFNSVIKASNFFIKEAGYCLSGDDAKHSISSIIGLAKDYQNRDAIYKTRS